MSVMEKNSRQVTENEARSFADANGLIYFECSAKNGEFSNTFIDFSIEYVRVQ